MTNSSHNIKDVTNNGLLKEIKMKKQLSVLLIVFFILGISITLFAQNNIYTKPDDAVKALFADYKKLTFRNALEYTTDELNDHIQKIVDYMNMNGDKVPENFSVQSSRMENMEIFRSEIIDAKYAIVGASWLFKIKDPSTNSLVKKIKKFGFLLANDGEKGWKIFKMSFLTEQILYDNP